MKTAIQQKSLWQSRVIKGKTAPGPIPWQVHLRKGIPNRRYAYFCGGTIIDAKTILTAAHCFDDFDIKANDFFIYAGALHKFDNFAQYIFVKSITIHEFWCGKACAAKGGKRNNANDIAILKLKTSLVFDDKVQPACLPDASFIHEGIGVASGWGQINRISKYYRPKFPDNLQVGVK